VDWGADVVVCLGQGADLHMAHSMSLASVKSRLVLVLAQPGSPGKRAVKRVCMCLGIACG